MNRANIRPDRILEFAQTGVNETPGRAPIPNAEPNMSTNDALTNLLHAMGAKLKTDLDQVQRCIELLSDEQAWSRPNKNCNSAANLIIHLEGNVRQWALAGLGDESFDRDRPAEFDDRAVRPVAPLMARLTDTVTAAIRVIRGMTAAEAARVRQIQGYEISGLVAAFHVTEHFGGHAAQIVHITKTLLDVNLSLYDPHGRRLDPQGGSPWA